MSWQSVIKALFSKCKKPRRNTFAVRGALVLNHDEPQKTRFEKRLAAALHPRWAKTKNKSKKSVLPPLRSHLAAFLDDFCPSVRHKDVPLSASRNAVAGELMTELSDGSKLIVGAVAAAGLDVAEAIRGKVTDVMTAAEREAALEKRRKYYETYNAKRRAESQFIASQVVAPKNPCPAPEELLDAYRHRRDGDEGILRFGNLMLDLEEHVRHTIKTEGNKIVGASGGVRDWLEKNCPELAKHYHTCQRFKRKVQEGPCD